jgi:hypothetical protein
MKKKQVLRYFEEKIEERLAAATAAVSCGGRPTFIQR